MTDPKSLDVAVAEARVTYTTKELLQRIDTRFEHLERLAESGTPRMEHVILIGRVDKLERDSEGTKAVATALLASGKDRFSRNEKVAGMIFAAIALTPAVTTIVQLFTH